MYHLPLTLETPAANLALDEALLEAAEAGELADEVLRLWEPAEFFVVLGRSSPLSEVHADACRRDGVPILRRASGGGTVVAGPGCLMYAVVLDLVMRPELKAVDRAHQFVLGVHAKALSRFAPGVACAGTSDLTLPPSGVDGEARRKFSGNSLRVRRRHVLYHGAVLYDFPLTRIGEWLARPARQPGYRAERSHDAFLANLPCGRAELATALVDGWQARQLLDAWPCERTAALAATRYATIQRNARSRGAGDLLGRG